MPTIESYSGLTLVEAMRQFADHHYESRTRHITQDEYKLLYDAADWMEQRDCSRRVEQ